MTPRPDTIPPKISRRGDLLMKTRWALLLPVLLGTLAGSRLELRAQAPTVPPAQPAPGGSSTDPSVAVPSAAAPVPARQVPLGIPSTLGAPTPSGTVSGPAYAGFVAPAGYAPGGMGDMLPATAFAAQPFPPGMVPPGMMPGVVPAGYDASGYMMGGAPDAAYGAAPMGEYIDEGNIGSRTERGLDLIRNLGPYPGGGWCSPRWFDVAVDFMYLTREDTGRTVNFMSDGPAGMGAPFIVLSTDNLDFDQGAGFRFSAALQVGASSALEFGYFGLFNWASAAAVTSPTDDLYSVMSDYGNNPPPQVGPPIVRGGFTDTDSAEYGSIEYSSNFDSLELDFRRRWMAPNCRLQGSWLAGVRYFRLEEQFRHNTRVNYPDPNGGGAPPITGYMNYNVGTANSVTGFQMGGDLWATLFPGIQVGSELKAGIFGNHADQVTLIEAATLAGPLSETADRDSAAFIAEAGLMGNWRVNQHITLRGGYNFLYVDGVALAAENFNAAPPFVAGRVVGINSNGDVFYHGFNAGFEWMW
ncbi:MAG: hypothetical protein FJ297_04655 [Planctomycetes bacterium]|nr:hypothetical protein [Planctomycetota bacterium]